MQFPAGYFPRREIDYLLLEALAEQEERLAELERELLEAPKLIEQRARVIALIIRASAVLKQPPPPEVYEPCPFVEEKKVRRRRT